MGSRFNAGTAPATVIGDELEHIHWSDSSGKGPREDDPRVRIPDHARRTIRFQWPARDRRGEGAPMKKTIMCGLALVLSATVVAACNDSFDDVAPNYDGGLPDGATGDATTADGGAT